MVDIRETIKSNGWNQGCCFTLTDLPSDFHSAIPAHLRSSNYLFVVVTHSCTLVNPDLDDEPFFEVIAFAIAKEKQGNDMNLKNTRRLCLDVGDGFAARYLTAHARDRFPLPRQALLGFSPTANSILSTVNIHTVISWLVLRYSNVAFPDTFDFRLNQIRKSLIKLFGCSPFVQSQLYICLTPLNDAAEDEPYHLNIMALLSEDELHQLESSNGELLQKAEEDIRELFSGCKGIELKNFTFASPQEFNAKLQQTFFRWTNFDQVSVKAGRETAALNPGHST